MVAQQIADGLIARRHPHVAEERKLDPRHRPGALQGGERGEGVRFESGRREIDIEGDWRGVGFHSDIIERVGEWGNKNRADWRSACRNLIMN